MKYIQISTTTAKASDAKSIADHLVKNKLAACVQIIGPIESIYRWKGKIERSKEWLCLIKAKAGSFEKIERAIKKLHPYEVPEIVAAPIVHGSAEYLKWLN